jgi:hypothetical protein
MPSTYYIVDTEKDYIVDDADTREDVLRLFYHWYPGYSLDPKYAIVTYLGLTPRMVMQLRKCLVYPYKPYTGEIEEGAL